MSLKIPIGINVLQAAQQRISFAFDNFSRICVSFSGGKDSSVMLHLAAAEARKRGRQIGVLVIDLEAQYRLTIAHIEEMLDLYADVVEPYWIALPIILRNAVSMYQPRWLCWDPEQRDMWVREQPESAITDERFFPFFKRGMEFEEFVPAFGEWFAHGKLTCCMVGIRTDESLNRFRAIMGDRSRFEGQRWTVWKGDHVFNGYPIYDWRTEDLWTFSARTRLPYNALYNRMHQAGLSVHQMRICQPYGDDQRKGLWLYHVIEPQTWPRVVARVNGANSGALYAQESGNILGNIRIKRPAGHTWRSFTELMLASLPPASRLHYENKFAVFIKWYADRGYPNGIPDEADPKDEATRKVPSWRRLCKVLLKNDYWCKGLGFGQTKSDAYERYLKVMKNRRAQWGF
jgi:predicted phosphoadenosine phosphosulfate sulfurtransferase